MVGIISKQTGFVPHRKQREYGHWAEVVSSAGKVYYYNRVTEQSQWVKPEGWEKAESVIFPVIERLQRLRNGEEEVESTSRESECLAGEEEEEDDDISLSGSDSLSEISMQSSGYEAESGEEESRPNSAKENQHNDEIAGDKYYRAELAAGMELRFMTREMSEASDALSSSLSFETRYVTQCTEMFRARALTRTASSKATEFQKEAVMLSSIRKRLEESRDHFKSNFDSEVRRILKRSCRDVIVSESPSSSTADQPASLSPEEPDCKKHRIDP